MQFPRSPFFRSLALLTSFHALASLAACGHAWQPKPVSMASTAVICQRGRPVYCEAGNTQCVSLKTAVDRVNAVVPGLLVYKGEVPRDQVVTAMNDPNAVPAIGLLQAEGAPSAAAEYQGLPIAFTNLRPSPADTCLPSTPIVIVWPVDALDRADWDQVVAHELLHALGAQHAYHSCPYSTIMRPALEEEHRVGFSKSDKNWLRAVYGD